MADQAVSIPSLYRVVCPKCGSPTWTVIGKKGAIGKSIGVGAAFGAIGNLVVSSNSQNTYDFSPVYLQCASCKNKWETPPLVAQADEILAAPCMITFTRVGSMLGMAVNQSVWLNGVKVASIGNGKSIEIPTYIRFNTLYVTDAYGVAFKGHAAFEATPGGHLLFKFNRKFVA
ncbi:MAG: hypothetical protein FWF28_09340 [Micrococcales bacterium]|nr:hypothetical protein [Micrococcales bacterium]